MNPGKALLRPDMMPHILCPGCGHGIVLNVLIRVLARRYASLDKVALVAGIGCSSRIVGYIDANTLHTTHGRALSFATGLKLARPDMTVIVVTGDGDGLGIGGNHLIHAARRNVDLTCILFNNETYGMTGGQLAPTTVTQAYTTTSPYGNRERAFDAALLATAAGATFVARGQAFRPDLLDDLLDQALDHRGFSFVDVMTDCTEYFGRKNALGGGSDLLFSQSRSDVEVTRDLNEWPQLQDPHGFAIRETLAMGVLHESDRPTLEAVMGLSGYRRGEG
ncbi:MAG: thiamine pyrophosphate-dependent enzyme [Thermaerobacter sp.]|nr:thiamine pyrophosphate-dependent enzyme [Thermaerobacter sp.]